MLVAENIRSIKLHFDISELKLFLKHKNNLNSSGKHNNKHDTFTCVLGHGSNEEKNNS